MAEQTVMKEHIQWLYDNQLELNIPIEVIEDAEDRLEMEKQQIIDAYDQDLYGGLSGKSKFNHGVDYYAKTYGTGVLTEGSGAVGEKGGAVNKGSDETNGNNVEKVPNVVTPFLEGYEQINQDNPVTRGSTALVKVTSSQTEISEPNPQLIESMCYRYRHDFGFLKDNHKESIRTTMKQLWEEVVGKGFYKQKEISDEEIEKAAIEKYPYNQLRDGEFRGMLISAKKNAWIDAIKWYREQIKKK